MKVSFALFIFIISNATCKYGFGQTQEKLIQIMRANCDTLKLSGGGKQYTWTSGNQDIVSVSDEGIICGESVGETYISAISKAKNGSFKFNVTVASDNNTTVSLEKKGSNLCSAASNLLQEIVKDKYYTDINAKLKVSANKRYLVNREDGTPFLFLSQTLWGMTRRMSREEIIEVLDICKVQGFTAIQLIAHSHYMGKNVYEVEPFENEKFTCPAITLGNNPQNAGEYDWWDHLEFVIEECVKRDIIVCLLPTWREQWNQKQNLHVNNAFAYGEFIGRRYKHLNKWLIWVLGGDAAPDSEKKLTINRALAKGISWGINGKEQYENLMMTYHTYGPSITNRYFNHDEPFMDFNTIQSGHSLDHLEGMIESSYQSQNKPTIDFEPFYDKNGQLVNETRTTIYWGVFSGGFGTSYGSWNIWHCGSRNDIAKFEIPQSFEKGYGKQIKHLRAFLESHSMELRMPNQNVLVENTTSGHERILSNVATDSSYIYVYSPCGNSFKVDLNFIKKKKINYKWFNPRNGDIANQGKFKKVESIKEFSPPTQGKPFSGNDWILILD